MNQFMEDYKLWGKLLDWATNTGWIKISNERVLSIMRDSIIKLKNANVYFNKLNK